MTWTAEVTDRGLPGFSWVVYRDGVPQFVSQHDVPTEVQAGFDAQTAAGDAWPGSYTVVRAPADGLALTGWTRSIGGTDLSGQLMTRATASSTSHAGPVSVVMPYAGFLVALSVAASSARTAGYSDFTVSVNGIGGILLASLDVTNPQHVYTAQAWGDATFDPGDTIEVSGLSQGGFLPDPCIAEATVFVTIDPPIS